MRFINFIVICLLIILFLIILSNCGYEVNEGVIN